MITKRVKISNVKMSSYAVLTLCTCFCGKNTLCVACISGWDLHHVIPILPTIAKMCSGLSSHSVIAQKCPMSESSQQESKLSQSIMCCYRRIFHKLAIQWYLHNNDIHKNCWIAIFTCVPSTLHLQGGIWQWSLVRVWISTCIHTYIVPIFMQEWMSSIHTCTVDVCL